MHSMIMYCLGCQEMQQFTGNHHKLITQSHLPLVHLRVTGPNRSDCMICHGLPGFVAPMRVVDEQDPVAVGFTTTIAGIFPISTGEPDFFHKQ